ncbi:hypothetical protein C2G38_2004892 [Gigaspora rosea]|uniref:Uncharacterized protein n=1 Tax=Gigaspora rosea TaxID=44941 RepID=A0A397UNU8_9GLOM|nr:hypothetical protein C2G38_2004892 [Gigaspora rosea]
MRAIMGYWRSLDLFCGNYLDDFGLAHPSLDTLIKMRDEVMKVDLERYGLVQEPEKGQWTASQRVKFFGLVIDTVKAQVIVPEEKITKTGKLLQALAKRKEYQLRSWLQ